LAWFLLIAGPNGAGKTTFTGSPDFQNALKLFPGGQVRLLNPDDAAKAFYSGNPGVTRDAADYWAANEIPAQVVKCIDAGENVAVETVLSSDKYETILQHARQQRYQVGLIYLALESAKVSKERVAKRVASRGPSGAANKNRGSLGAVSRSAGQIRPASGWPSPVSEYFGRRRSPFRKTPRAGHLVRWSKIPGPKGTPWSERLSSIRSENRRHAISAQTLILRQPVEISSDQSADHPSICIKA
jgi:predicted ABC-type ATPase